MELPKFTVLVRDADEHAAEHVVTIRHGDQLRAELEGPRLRLPALDDAPIAYMTLWCWAALVRSGAYDGKAAQFLGQAPAFDGDCLGVEEYEEQRFPGDPEGPEDPTQRAAVTG